MQGNHRFLRIEPVPFVRRPRESNNPVTARLAVLLSHRQQLGDSVVSGLQSILQCELVIFHVAVDALVPVVQMDE